MWSKFEDFWKSYPYFHKSWHLTKNWLFFSFTFFNNKFLKQEKKKKEKNANNSSHIRYFCFESKVTMYAATLEALESLKQYILQHYSFLPEVFKIILFTNCHKQKWREKILLYPSQKYNHPRVQLNKISQCLALMKLQIIWGS